ncbi:STAS domain-containing protein [Pseudomonas cremoricolorata]|uniref:Anti-sigma factor antagonist n=1 Tax=Pseudomonas cremoricolorata TaxID=157783 RepID=A0A089WND4_9PSED|nr:STAS domain-containing protein [Pseudomonas cremoricolorata]AIR88007.1 anti-sigma factor antagonist [Pseudomonas cremoricolorata]
MNQAGVSMTEQGVLRLTGVLDYRSGPALRKQGAVLIAACKGPQVVLDCSAVSHSSSVGLSLLLGFLRDITGAGKFCELRGLPQHMREIAEVYDLDQVLADF